MVWQDSCSPTEVWGQQGAGAQLSSAGVLQDARSLWSQNDHLASLALCRLKHTAFPRQASHLHWGQTPGKTLFPHLANGEGLEEMKMKPTKI